VIDWAKIETFIGYGNADARVVFLGMEEGLRRDADLEADLRARSKYEPYMDLLRAQTDLDGPSAYFGEAPITQKTWRPMCHLMLRMAGVSKPSREERLRYQADKLGRHGGDTLLAELLPYPHSDSGQWLYGKFGRFKSREAYAETVIPRRQVILRELFRAHAPDFIVAYGKENWPHYQAIFNNAEWAVDGPFSFAQWGKSHVILTHALSGRQFNTDDQLDRFASIVLRHLPTQAALQDALKQPPVIEVTDTGQALRRANRQFREAFGALVRSFRSASGLTIDSVSDKARAFAGQGNSGGVRNLEAGRGWVDPNFAHGVFLAVNIPDAEEMALGYAKLKTGLHGVTKECD